MKTHQNTAVEEYLEALLSESEGELLDDIREVMLDPGFDQDWDEDNGMSLSL